VDLATAEIEKLYPGFTAKIEVVSAATPTTYERYTGNHRGSIKGWLDDGTNISDHLKKFGMNLPGLAHFYMIGAWVSHGGMIRVVASGRHVIRTLCKRDGKPFQTQIPRASTAPESAGQVLART
jgi:phytoene dehydrogenase-like protein